MFTCRRNFVPLAEAVRTLPFLQRAVEAKVIIEANNQYAPNNDMPCWVWRGWLDATGYGRLQFNDQKAARVHRVTFESLRRPLLATEVLDHLCRNRACCNPWHLEPVSSTVNTQRGARATGMCRNGLHAMTGSNVIVRTRGGLDRYECRACKEARR